MSPVRAPVRIPSLTPKGMDFTRTIMALAVTKNREAAANYASHRFGEESLQARVLKAAVGAVDTLSTGGGAELAGWNATVAEFFGMVRERTIYGQMTGLRAVPFDVRLINTVTGLTAYWVGEGAPAPVSAATYAEDDLEPRKCVAISVVTDDLLNSSNPAAERAIREDLITAVSGAIDLTFIDPTNAGSAGVKPASVTNGITGTASTGDPEDDIAQLLASFSGDLSQAYFVGSPLTLATMNSIHRPNVGARGGEIAGIPAIASTAAADNLALLDASAIALGEGDTVINTSRQGTLEMLDNPTNNAATPTATTQVSLFQNNSAAIMVQKTINFERVRDGSSLVTNVAYVAGIS